MPWSILFLNLWDHCWSKGIIRLQAIVRIFYQETLIKHPHWFFTFLSRIPFLLCRGTWVTYTLNNGDYRWRQEIILPSGLSTVRLPFFTPCLDGINWMGHFSEKSLVSNTFYKKQFGWSFNNVVDENLFSADVSSKRSVDRCSVNKIKIAELTSNKTVPLSIDDVSINVQEKNWIYEIPSSRCRFFSAEDVFRFGKWHAG